jgi:Rrf2 family protein
VRISAKVDYAVRAALELSRRSPDRDHSPTTGDQLGDAQAIPTKYLESIMSELRRAGIVASRRGADGGYWMARPAADLIRAVEGPLADVRGQAPEDLDYRGAAAPLEKVWLATRVALRHVLEGASLADICADDLPESLEALLDDPDARARR